MATNSSNTSPVVIRATGLTMRYGTRDVLDGIDLQVCRGEVVALLGPNGAGKTTTVEILEGFRVPSAGDVEVLGHRPASAPESWRAGVGIVLQSWRDHKRWRVRDVLAHLGAYYAPYGTPERPRPRDTDELLALVGLTASADQMLMRLSGGQRRRLDVAIGIVGRPEVLFLDEPTAGFDPEARRDFHEIVHNLVDLEETTILLTTHDLGEAERLADRILVLAGGHIVADGSPEQLARQVGGQAEVRWTVDGERFVHSTADATGYVRQLFAQHGDAVDDLEVRRANLEDAYLELVRRHAGGAAESADHRGPSKEVA